MGKWISQVLAPKQSGPRLHPGQELRPDAARRLGLSPESFERAKAHAGFPVGESVIFFDGLDPRQTTRVSVAEVDEWAAMIKALANELK